MIAVVTVMLPSALVRLFPGAPRSVEAKAADVAAAIATPLRPGAGMLVTTAMSGG